MSATCGPGRRTGEETVKVNPRVELVFDSECPNVDRAREAIRTALNGAGAPEVWQEWDRSSLSTPERLRKLGSPSVLVDGQVVGCGDGENADADANSCRIYIDGCGCLCGAPPVEMILKALNR